MTLTPPPSGTSSPPDDGSFAGRLAIAQRTCQSVLCVGLDPDLERIPDAVKRSRSQVAAVEHFCRQIVEATAEFACAYKLNFAFFERLGDEAIPLLRRIRHAIPADRLTIADAKRGDIGNSARFYADSALGDLGFDSITASPYMGFDSVQPFLSRAGTATFVLVRTSNPGRTDIQDLVVDGSPLFEHVARIATDWGKDQPGEIGFVVGASDLAALRRLRAIAPEACFLVPGVGAQGGRAEDVMAANGSRPGSILVNSSRGICYASSGPDFAEAARDAASSAARALAPADTATT